MTPEQIETRTAFTVRKKYGHTPMYLSDGEGVNYLNDGRVSWVASRRLAHLFAASPPPRRGQVVESVKVSRLWVVYSPRFVPGVRLASMWTINDGANKAQAISDYVERLRKQIDEANALLATPDKWDDAL